MSSDGHIVLFRRAPAELNRRNLERFARVLRDEVAGGAGFECLVTDDRELRRLNRTFLAKDYATDVLSFPRGANEINASEASRHPPAPSPRPPVPHLGESEASRHPPAPGPRPPAPYLGEIAISADRASAQAREYGHPIDAEIRILMLHGVLHLLGMDHETDSGQMARAEAEWRQRLALPAGLTERVRS